MERLLEGHQCQVGRRTNDEGGSVYHFNPTNCYGLVDKTSHFASNCHHQLPSKVKKNRWLGEVETAWDVEEAVAVVVLCILMQ